MSFDRNHERYRFAAERFTNTSRKRRQAVDHLASSFVGNGILHALLEIAGAARHGYLTDDEAVRETLCLRLVSEKLLPPGGDGRQLIAACIQELLQLQGASRWRAIDEEAAAMLAVMKLFAKATEGKQENPAP